MKKIATFALLSIISTSAFAEADGGFQIGVATGALQGASMNVGYRFSGESYWSNAFAVRAEYSTLKPFKSMIEDYKPKIEDTEFEIFAKGKQAGILLDYYPFASTWFLGNFRISGGYYFGDFEAGAKHNEILATGQTFDFDFNGHNYIITATSDVDADLVASLKADTDGPYAGVGFDIGFGGGFKMFIDAGIIKIDKPKLLTDINVDPSYINFTVDGTPHSGASVQPEINLAIQQMRDKFNEDLKTLTDKEFFPMVKVGFLYRF